MFKTLSQAILVACVMIGGAQAQQPAPGAAASPGIKRVILQRVEIPGTNFETVLGMAEIAPGANAGRHTHPGPETGTVTEIPAGTIHDVRTVGGAARVVAAYMVPKGMPLASPAK